MNNKKTTILIEIKIVTESKAIDIEKNFGEKLEKPIKMEKD